MNNGHKIRMDRVRDLRIGAGWTLEKLSTISGVNIQTLSRIELGKQTHVQIKTGFRIAQAYGKPVDYLMERGTNNGRKAR